MQAMKQFKKDGSVGDVAPIPYTAMCINGIVWMSYGALQGEPTIWAPNISAFLFGTYYVHTYSKYTTTNMMPKSAQIKTSKCKLPQNADAQGQNKFRKED